MVCHPPKTAIREWAAGRIVTPDAVPGKRGPTSPVVNPVEFDQQEYRPAPVESVQKPGKYFILIGFPLRRAVA
jgi:hypothetical protein